MAAVDFSKAFSTAYSAFQQPGQGPTTVLDILKGILGIAISDTSQDAILAVYLNMAGSAAERYIDNIILSRQVTEKLAHRNTPIALRYWPVTGPVAIEVDGLNKSGDWHGYEEDGVRYVTPESCGKNRSECFNQIMLTYTAGYDPIPSDLAYAIAQAATVYENQQGRGSVTTTAGGAVKKEVIQGVGSIEYDTGGLTGGVSIGSGGVGMLPLAVVDILDLYKRWHC